MKVLMLSFLLLFHSLVRSQSITLTPSDNGSSVVFKIKNFGWTVDGSFTGLKGHIVFNSDNITASSFNVSVDAATVKTGIGSRDAHLRKAEYFDVTNYPAIKITSTKVTAAGSGTYILHAKLYIKNKEKDIDIPFTAIPQGNGQLFRGKFSINRREFDVGSGSISLSDNLTVNLSVLAK